MSRLPFVVAITLFAGCGLPRDPEGTLDRVRGGVLRVGISANEPWAEWKGGLDSEIAAGVEPELIQQFARELDAEVEWVQGSETELLTALERFDLDVVAAGLKDDTLWSDRVGLTRPYAEAADGSHVLAVAPGENAFLLRLGRFLARQENAIETRLAKEGPAATKATVQ